MHHNCRSRRIKTQAQQLAQAGIGSFQPFVAAAQQQVGAAGATLGGIGTGAQSFQQDISQFMSPFQTQVIDASLAEFDRNAAQRQQQIRDQQAKVGVLGAGRAGVQLAEFGTGRQEKSFTTSKSLTTRISTSTRS